jgi:hypothetical protein
MESGESMDNEAGDDFPSARLSWAGEDPGEPAGAATWVAAR